MSDISGKGGIIPFEKQNFSKWGSDDALLHVQSSEARGHCGAERVKRPGTGKGGAITKAWKNRMLTKVEKVKNGL